MNDIEFTRFMSHVEVGDCWLWTGKSSGGYGYFRLRGKMKLTHRLMLERVLGRALREGMETLHSCRKRHCCRPEHLREGTQQENMEDRDRDGTTAQNSGEQHGRSKLTEEQVRAIRADARSQRVIAKEYGVTQRNISMIKRRESWKHI